MSSFERLKPAPAAPAGPAAPLGALGKIALGSHVPGLSPFRDFGGSDAPTAASESGAPETLAVDEAQQVAEAAYADGFAAGREAAIRELVAEGETFARAIMELERFRASLLERHQNELLALALGIARKVVQRELAEHPEHWLGMIREAVRHALDREKIRIRVGTVLHRFLVERLPTLRPMLEDVKEMELVEDPTLAENGCILESQFGDLDLGVDSQIGAIRAALTQVG